MNNIPKSIQEAREARRCKGDDCDQNHCPGCGAHTLGWLDTFQRCSTCEDEREHMVQAEVNRANDLRRQRTQEQKFLDEAHEIRQAEIQREANDMIGFELEAEAQAAMFDDDPNPYHGDYSEQ